MRLRLQKLMIFTALAGFVFVGLRSPTHPMAGIVSTATLGTVLLASKGSHPARYLRAVIDASIHNAQRCSNTLLPAVFEVLIERYAKLSKN